MQDSLLLNSGGIPNLSGPKIDPRDYPTIKCKLCGSIVFDSTTVLKEIPGTVVGQGTEPVVVPLQVYSCHKCGLILDSDIKVYKLEKDIESTEEKYKEDNIIL